MKEKLRELLKHKKSISYYSSKMGISEKEVSKLLREIKNETSTSFSSQSLSVNNDEGTLKSEIELDFEPKTDEDLAILHKIDLSKYKISSYWSKLKSNGKFTSSVFATLRKYSDYSAEDFANFLETYEPLPFEFGLSIKEGYKDFVDVEFSIADFHLAKKTLVEETLEDRVEQFNSTLVDLINKVKGSFDINKVVFPISNDFFHTDNYQNQTTNGTPQDVLTGFDHEYEVGFDLLVKAISKLSIICSVLEVVLVQGNHDRTKSFYLAHALEVYFKSCPNIVFQREHSTTKSVVLGSTFIGYHHGNCKIDDLPLLFATGKDASSFGNSLYREVHTGDKHHYMAKEIKGVRVQQMPSLSGTDRWHQDNNFVNSIRAGIATCFHPIKGRIAEFESRI